MEKAKFKIVSMCPIGFRTIVYPTKYCPICRGFLVEKCSTCAENDDGIDCTVSQYDNLYYHSHCYNLKNKK